MKLFKKIFRVIDSCETNEQLIVAKKYLDIACEKGHIDERFRNAIHYNIFLDKFEKINS